jgi:GNAT superfamily N-acetyltransferase
MTELRIRPLVPGDADALRAFHDTLSATSVYARFFTARGPLTDAEVHYFTGADQHSRVALAALAGDVLVGVGRYDCLPATSDAEIACVVTDKWQGRGVGTLLVASLARIARAAGVRRFVADTHSSNGRMLHLLSELAPLHTTFDHECAHVELELAPAGR